MVKIACSHPGKMGDALYTLPTIKSLCERHGCKADFYTSDYCAPMHRLFEMQPYIDRFIIPAGYRVQRMDCGCQPWQMPIPEHEYAATYQLGFRGHPNCSIQDYIAQSAGVAQRAMELVFPTLDAPILDGAPYLCLAARGETSYRPLFQEIMRQSRLPIVQIGTVNDMIEGNSVIRAEDFAETAAIIAGSSGFIGLMSSLLVIANAFPVVKVAPHDGVHWDTSHLVQSPLNYYPVNPSAEQVLHYFEK